MSSKQSRKAIQHFEELIDDFKKHSRKVIEQSQVEEVHLLRRTVRRIRSLLWVFRQGGRVKVSKKLREELRAWSRALGERREFDVLIEDSGHFHVDSEIFRAERARADETLKLVITKASRKDLLSRFERIVRRLHQHPNLHEGKVLRHAYERYFPLIEKWPREMTSLHQIRIDAKKMRYILEAFDLPSEPLHEFESALGRAHDLEVLKDKNFKQ